MLQIIGAVGGGLLVGFLAARHFYMHEVKKVGDTSLPTPLEDAEYEKDRNFYIEIERHSMDQYDRLVPWGAGGALLLSVTVLKNLTTAPSPDTRWVLAAGWGCLFVALGSSIAGHFTSSRIFASMREALDAAQKGLTDEDSRVVYRRHAQAASTAGIVTAALNVTALVGFLAGIGFLIVFAYLNL